MPGTDVSLTAATRKGETLMENNPGRNPGESGTGQGGRVTEQAKEQTQQVAHQTQQQASQAAHQARQKAKSQLATQKERAAGTLGGVAQALRQTGQQLQEQDQGSVGNYAQKAADRVERFSGYLRQRDVDQLVGEAESFARRNPVPFLGGALALGFFATRFLKSSSEGGSSGRGGSRATGEQEPSVGVPEYSPASVEEPALPAGGRSPSDIQREQRERTEPPPSRGF
jgi:hypothetical protein